MSEILIREMKEEEIEECAGVIRRGFGTVADKFGLTLKNCPTNGAFMTTERLRSDWDKGNNMYVLQKDAMIIGFMQLEHKEKLSIELEKLTVLPQFRHYGYGRKMLEFAGRKATELGADQITIGIIEENMVLREWYLKNGFVHNGTRIFNHLPFTVGFLSCPL